MLYLIEILHQTTTASWISLYLLLLYLIEILHQTTTVERCTDFEQRCILLKFYIKPQRGRRQALSDIVVSYWNSTSNHNVEPTTAGTKMLYLIEILHQTTTVGRSYSFDDCCILLKFYIKPQQALPVVYSYWGCILLKFYIKPQQNC